MNSIILLTIAGTIAAPVPAPTAGEPQPTAARNTDPVVCRGEQIIGSRLAKKQRCLKVSEWLEMKRLNREVTEKVQMRADERTN